MLRSPNAQLALLLAFTFFLQTWFVRHASAAPEPWQVEYSAIDLKSFRFEHPMTVIDRAELELVSARIAAGAYPQAVVFPILIREARAALAFEPDAPETMEIMAGYAPGTNLEAMREWLWRNRTAAYTTALAYAYTGEAQYAEKAAQILNAWAHKGTTFTGYDAGLQLASWFSGMLYAADLIYDYPGWPAAERERFKDWWRRNVLPHTRQVMLERSNNWKDAGILGVLAAAVVLEDEALLREGLIELTSYFYERTDENVVHKGVWKIRSDEQGVYLPKEVVRNSGVSGVTYTGYALTSAVQALEIARYAGYNLWHHTTPQGVTFQHVIEWYFRWDVGGTPFPWHASPNRGKTRKNPYEVANNHYNLMPEIGEWLRWNRPVNGEQGDEWVTLNKGDLPPVTNPGPGTRLRILDGYEGTYSVHYTDGGLELFLAGQATPAQKLTLNVWHVDGVTLAETQASLPYEVQEYTTTIYLPEQLSFPARIALKGAGDKISGIHSVAVPSLDRQRIHGPAPIRLEIVSEPADLPLADVSLLIDGFDLHIGTNVPDGMVINTGELSDGLHWLTVRVESYGSLSPYERHIGFEVANTVINLPENDAVAKGDMTIDVTGYLPPESVARSFIKLVPMSEPHETVTVWQGGALPEPLTYDTRQVEDGRYRMVVETVTRAGAVSQAETWFVVRNRWQLIDPLEAPQVFFGAVWDRSLTVHQSPGWVYATDAPHDFFGDTNRKLRSAPATEELVWEAPFLREVAVNLYSRETDIGATLELSLSSDGERWVTVPYETTVIAESQAGWYHLRAVGTVTTPGTVRYFRLMLLDSSIPYDAIQIGDVHLEGR